MSKKIKYLFVISILVLSLLVLPFSVLAAEDSLSFNVNLSPIFSNDNMRFIEVLTKNSDGEYFVSILIFNVVISPDNTYSQSSVNLSAVLNGTDTVLTIETEGLSDSVANYYISVYSCDSFGNISYEDKSYNDVLTFNFPNKVFGIHYYGFQFFSGGLPNSNIPFFVNYSSNASILNYLSSILESNQQFYQTIDDYFNDDTWSLLSDISEELFYLRSYLDPSGQNNLYDYLFSMSQDSQEIRDYLFSMSQDSQEILEYLVLFNNYFTDQVFSIFSDINITLLDLYDYLYNDLSFYLSEYLTLLEESLYGNDFPEATPPSDVSPPRVDSTIQDIEDAEQEALGGMTQEEVKEQVDEVLDSSSEAEEIGATEINVNNISVVNNLFTDMFGVFGGAWSTFFLLNLTIAFAAFLIGRRY